MLLSSEKIVGDFNRAAFYAIKKTPFSKYEANVTYLPPKTYNKLLDNEATPNVLLQCMRVR